MPEVLVSFHLECLVTICQLNFIQHSSSSKIINSNRSNSWVSTWIMACILTWWHQYSVILEPFNSDWSFQTSTFGQCALGFFFRIFNFVVAWFWLKFSSILLWSLKKKKVQAFQACKKWEKTLLTINNYHDTFL